MRPEWAGGGAGPVGVRVLADRWFLRDVRWELLGRDLVLEGVGAVKFLAEVWRAKYQAYAARFEPAFGPQDDPSDHDPLLQQGPEA